MWCLERAIETRNMCGVSNMEVTNLAEHYFKWISLGVSQAGEMTAGELACAPEGDAE